MSRNIVKVFSFECDGILPNKKSCLETFFSDSSESMDEARKELRANGWYSGTGKKDYCPNCKVKMLGKNA